MGLPMQPVVAILDTASGLVLVKGNCLLSLDGSLLFKHSLAFTGVACSDASHQLALADTSKAVLFVDCSEWTVKGSVRIAKSPTAIGLSGTQWFVADRFGDISKVNVDGSLAVFGGSVSTVTDLACCPRHVLASDRDEKIRCFDADTGNLSGFLLSHKLYVSCLCLVGPEPCKLASAGGDPFVCIWDVPVEQTVCRPARQVAIEGHGVLAMCAFDSNIAIIYDDCSTLTVIISSDQEAAVTKNYKLDTKLSCIAHHRDQLVLGTLDGGILLCSAADGAVLDRVSLPQCDASVEPGSLFKSKYRKSVFDDHDDDGGAEGVVMRKRK